MSFQSHAPPSVRACGTRRFSAAAAQLFDFQWLARSDAGSLFLLFTYSSRGRLFINHSFFEQPSTGFAGAPYNGAWESTPSLAILKLQPRTRPQFSPHREIDTLSTAISGGRLLGGRSNRTVLGLEHVPPELNWQDSHGVLDRRFYRH